MFQFRNICTKPALVFPKIDKVIYAAGELCMEPYKMLGQFLLLLAGFSKAIAFAVDCVN